MENLGGNEIVSKSSEDSALDGEISKKKKRTAQGESKATIRAEIPDELARSVSQAIETLRERGVEKSSSDFVEFYLKFAAEADTQEWVDLETPMEWRLKAALADPLKEKLIKTIFGLSSAEDAATLTRIEKALFNEELTKKEKRRRGQRSSDVKENVVETTENLVN